MKQIFTIWMQPIYVNLNNPKDRSGRLLLLVLPISILLYCGLQLINHESITLKKCLVFFSFACMTCLLLGLGIWYLLLVVYSMLQNTQANAYLVPKFPQYLRAAIFIPMMIFPVLATLIGTLLFHQKNASFIWFVGVLITLIITGTFRFYKIAALLLISCIFIFEKQLINDDIFNYLSQLNGLIVGLLSVILNITLLYFLFKPSLQISNKKKKIKFFTTIGSFLSVLIFPLRKISQYQLKHHPTAINLMRIAFFKHFHWTQTLGLWTIFTIVGFLIITFYLVAVNKLDRINHLQFFLVMCLAPTSYKAMTNGKFDLLNSGKEQALFILTAFAPNKQIQIKNVQAYLLRHFFIAWGLNYLLIMLLVIYMVPVSPSTQHWISYIHLFYLSHLPLCHSQLQNYATIDNHTNSEITKHIIFSVTLFLFMAGLRFYYPTISIYWYAVVVIVSTLISLFIRWKKIMKLEVMFPVGRAI